MNVRQLFAKVCVSAVKHKGQLPELRFTLCGHLLYVGKNTEFHQGFQSILVTKVFLVRVPALEI